MTPFGPTVHLGPKKDRINRPQKMASVLCSFMGKLSHAVVNRTAESSKKNGGRPVLFFEVNQPGRGP